jgi:hypothetical protein
LFLATRASVFLDMLGHFFGDVILMTKYVTIQF